MTQKNLDVYLNDHLAGSVAAVGLFDRLRRELDDPRTVRKLTEVRHEVVADKETLQELMARLDVSETKSKKAGASLAQKIANLKFRMASSKQGELQLLHALDSLSLGIEGKKALWIALEAAAEEEPRLRLASYRDLVERADQQVASLRDLRIDAAKNALVSEDGNGGDGHRRKRGATDS